MNKYEQLKNKQQEEINDFPMVFAFDNNQFKEGMEKLGLTENDTDKVCRAYAGGFIRKTDSKSLHSMFKRFDDEMDIAMKNDPTGENFIKDMFKFE